jgi:hypothetical protein
MATAARGVYALSSFRHRVHAAEMPPIPEIALMIG